MHSKHNSSSLPEDDIRCAERGFDAEDYNKNRDDQYSKYEEDRRAVLASAERHGIKSTPVPVGRAALRVEVQIDS